MSETTAIVLAAGKGTRMQSDLPKVLFPVLGRAMIHYVIDALEFLNVNKIIVVVGYRGDAVRAELKSRNNLSFVDQTQQLGTGHAVMCCRDELESLVGPVYVLAGDSPLVQTVSLKKLLLAFQKSKPVCLLGTLRKDDPTGLGRIIRSEQGEFLEIVEQKDATQEQTQIREVNMSTYLFDSKSLLEVLQSLKNENAQSEYYLTDCPKLMRGEGKKVMALDVLQPCESYSINNPTELAQVEERMQQMGYPCKN